MLVKKKKCFSNFFLQILKNNPKYKGCPQGYCLLYRKNYEYCYKYGCLPIPYIPDGKLMLHCGSYFPSLIDICVILLENIFMSIIAIIKVLN